ncbi:hypothetical protein [Alkalilimnicola ehrlichii]|nr:hypothetical protein [Alkalilimnicola ehrlichii]
MESDRIFLVGPMGQVKALLASGWRKRWGLSLSTATALWKNAPAPVFR